MYGYEFKGYHPKRAQTLGYSKMFFCTLELVNQNSEFIN